MRKTLVTGLMVASLMGVGLGLAAPAAATTLADNGDGSVTVSAIRAGQFDAVYICASPTAAAACSSLLAPDVVASINQDGTYSEGSTVVIRSPAGPGPLAAGTYTMVPITGGRAGEALLNFVIGGRGGGSSSTGITTQPQSVTLSLNTADGSSCSQSAASGFAGSWIVLPGANDCTAPAAKPGATLLGWATTPNFPVENAQRQIDNDWGAYEMVNDEGRLTAVFIPAGGATFLSSEGNLFAIWSE